MHSILITCSIISLTALVEGDFQMANHGEKCLDHSPLNPRKTCDFTKGFDCLGKSWKTDGFVCACYGTFIYDRLSKECRRRVGDRCLQFRKSEEWKRAWNEKCQEDSECSQEGICVCKKGTVRSIYSYNCVKPFYSRG